MVEPVSKTIFIDPYLWIKFKERYPGRANQRLTDLIERDLDQPDKENVKGYIHELVEKL